MRKNVLTMTLLAGLLLVSSCASKKDLEDCRQNNLKLLESSKEVFMNYQQTKEQLAAANARVTSLEEQLAAQKKAYAALQKSLDKSLTNQGQNNISIEMLFCEAFDRLLSSDSCSLAYLSSAFFSSCCMPRCCSSRLVMRAFFAARSSLAACRLSVSDLFSDWQFARSFLLAQLDRISPHATAIITLFFIILVDFKLVILSILIDDSAAKIRIIFRTPPFVDKN